MNNKELTSLYNDANGIIEGKNPPITTERIFAAMQAAFNQGLEAGAKVCEELNDEYAIPFNAVNACAAAIRALKQEQS